jgi:hypothetical protein
MAAMFAGREVAPETLRLMLLAYGMEHPYRVVTLNDITQALSHVRKQVVQEGLDQLAREGLVTKFAGRYCFNKILTTELRHSIERRVTTSGTVRKRNYSDDEQS